MSLQKIADYTKANQEPDGQPYVCLTYMSYHKVWVAELLNATGIPVLTIHNPDPLVALELLNSSACPDTDDMQVIAKEFEVGNE